ncbi:MAG: YesL family protein [Eubacteriales bacterium]|nr:YesL family protein [Eubacteriales bacterium]
MNKVPFNHIIFRFCEWVADLVILNLLWLICSLPIITIGASTSAVHYVIIKKLRKEPIATVRGFFAGFRLNFGQATILWLIYAALLADAWILLRLYCQGALSIAKLTSNIFISFAVVVFLATWLFTFIYAFPMLAILKLRLVDCFKNSVILSTRHILNTLIIIITSVALVLLVNQVYVLAIGIIGVIFYVWAALVYKTILPHLDKESQGQGGKK